MQKIIATVKSFLPRTFRSHILLAFLTISFGPFFFMSIYLYTSAQDAIKKTNSDIEQETVRYVVRLHQDHLNKQSVLIQQKLDEARRHALIAKHLAEDIFTNEQKYATPPPLQLKKEKEGYYWEDISGDFVNSAFSSRTPMSPALLEEMAKTKYLEPIFKTTVKTTPHIAAMYYIHPQSAWTFYPKMNVKLEIDHGYLPPDIDLTKQDFYSKALSIGPGKDDVVLTDTYTDITHRNKVFTLSTPIYANGVNKGIIGVDITRDQVMEHILNFQFKEKNAYALLLSDSLNFIAYQAGAKRDLPFYSESIRKFLYLSDKEQILEINGEEKIVLFSPIVNTNWKLIYVIPKSDVITSITENTKQLIQTNRKSFFTQFLTFTIVIFLYLLLSIGMIYKFFTTPMNNLMSGIAEISEGNFNTTVKVNYLEEFKQLGKSFNTMSGRIYELLNDYKHLNSELEKQVKERTKELSSVNQSLLETNATLEKIESSRRKMFANVAHDMKTPMTLVQGYIKAINDGIIQPDQIDGYLTKIYRHLDAMNQLVKDLYELSIVEMKEASFRFQIVDTPNYFKKIMEHYQTMQRVQIKMERNLSPVYIEPEYFKRAMVNVIENALKYSKDTVYVHIYQKENLIIEINDKGIGISDEDLPYIFDQFFRADKSRNSQVQGSGLGLAIVKEVIEAHDGKIEVTSKLGYGTTIKVILPLHVN